MLALKHIPSGVTLALMVSPFIGLVVGFATRPFYPLASVMAKFTLPLVSLYGAVGLFGIAAGIGDAVTGPQPRIASAVVIQSVFGLWWGLTFIWLIVLYPLSFLNHLLLDSLVVRYHQKQHGSAEQSVR